MKLPLFLIPVALLAACHHSTDGSGGTKPPIEDSRTIPSGSTAVKIWATHYYLLNVTPTQSGVPIRDMRDRQIGPIISELSWCRGAIEGSIRTQNVTYTYAGKRDPRQADCKLDKSERLRWTKTRNRYGTGSKNNALVPFRTIACDLGTVDNSRPWLIGGYAKFGQRIFIPDAVGTKLPGGKVHDGYFVCGDVGGHITGNHIDVFIGDASGKKDALKRDPFSFVKHHSSKTVQAYVIK